MKLLFGVIGTVFVGYTFVMTFGGAVFSAALLAFLGGYIIGRSSVECE